MLFFERKTDIGVVSNEEEIFLLKHWVDQRANTSHNRGISTDHFAISELQNPWIEEFYVVQKHQLTKIKLYNIRSGCTQVEGEKTSENPLK